MLTGAQWGLVAVGAGIMLVFFLLVVGSVVLVVHRHEIRELRVTTNQYNDLLSQMKDLKNLTLRAISGRDELERRMSVLEHKLGRLSERVNDLDSRGIA